MSQLQAELDQVDQQKHSDDLVKRAAVLAEKERLFDMRVSEFDEELLQTRIDAKKNLLDSYEKKLTEVKNRFDEAEENHRKRIVLLKESETDVKRDIDTAKAKLSEFKSSIKRHRDEDEVLKESIQTQKRYYSDQERVVENAINDWNDELRKFTAEASHLEDKKLVLLKQVDDLEQSKSLIDSEVASLEEKLTNLTSKYNNAASKYRKDLSDIRNTIESESSTFEERQKIVVEEEAALDLRQKEMEIKRKSQVKKDIELRDRERRLNSLESLL